MAYQTLYRKYRPKTFELVYGQDVIVKTLKNVIKNDKLSHAYLFTGPRGTGKTSSAKLFAKAINCLNNKDGDACNECENCKSFNNNSNPDIIEIDAASNNGVDEIREIKNKVSLVPSMSKYKVYIIDEVHMLSIGAFNALLKTLEEPPAHVIFILATTDPQKIIPTVLSRCQRYNFSKINRIDLKNRMKTVLNAEDLSYEEAALDIVANLAEGGMRDALSILDQILSYNDEGIFLEDVQKIFGLITVDEKINLLINIHSGNIEEVILKIRQMFANGINLKQLSIDLIEILKDTILYIDSANDNILTTINGTQAAQLKNYYQINSLLKDIDNLKECLQNRQDNFLSYLELSFLKMAEHTVKKEPIIKPLEIEQTKHGEIIIEKDNEAEITKENTEEDYLGFLAKVLYTANKNYKVADTLIFNRLELYRYDSDKRKYYELLEGTEFFASSKDAIIVVGPESKVKMINDSIMNEDLFNFVHNEFGIDKVIFGVSDNDRVELINRYKNLSTEEKNNIPEIKKYELKKTMSMEDKLKDLFGDVRVE